MARQRELLRRKRTALERGGWSFEAPDGATPEPKVLEAELDAIRAQLDALGADRGVLHAHLETVAKVLGDAEHQVWAQDIALSLDAMNIQRDASDPSARRIVLRELQNAQGRRAVMLPISLAPLELPPREDFIAAAQRYLY